jgi:hypothetical protein
MNASGFSYLMTLTGAGGPLVLPMATLTCSRRVGASSWLTATVPTWTAILESVLRAQSDWLITIDADSVEFLRATLTGITPDRNPQSGRIILTGRVINPPFTAQPRTLTGVTERSDRDGRRAARCQVDNLLRPNDTANDGISAWTVGIIEYEISPIESWMRVVEVAN